MDFNARHRQENMSHVQREKNVNRRPTVNVSQRLPGCDGLKGFNVLFTSSDIKACCFYINLKSYLSEAQSLRRANSENAKLIWTSVGTSLPRMHWQGF